MTQEYRSVTELSKSSVIIEREKPIRVPWTVAVLSEISLYEVVSMSGSLSYRVTLTSDTSCPPRTTKTVTTEEKNIASRWYTTCIICLLASGKCDLDEVAVNDETF